MREISKISLAKSNKLGREVKNLVETVKNNIKNAKNKKNIIKNQPSKNRTRAWSFTKIASALAICTENRHFFGDFYGA